MAERDYYEPIKSCLQALLKGAGSDFHLEITAARRFSNALKGEVGQSRDIVFHFLREAAPDITGFKGDSTHRSLWW